MTNHWTDIANANLVLVMGGNAAEAHPCGFKWVTEAKAHNKARLIVVDPRFTRTASVADYYAPIRTGTDIAFMGGLINYLLTEDKIQHEYVRNYTDVSFMVKAGYGFEDGIFSGYDVDKRAYTDKSGWGYELGEDGFVKTDPSLHDPRCVYQLMKQHYSRYNIELASQICGMPVDAMQKIWEEIATCSQPGKTMTILYALGWTQHSIGAQIIRSAAMVQLLLGNVGMPGGGVNALRGHSNIQGLTDLGLLSNSLPGYLTLPGDAEQDYNAYIVKRTQNPLRPGQLSYWQNYSKFHVSLMKAWYGANATLENNWAFDYLPKLDIPNYDILKVFDLMGQGKVNGYMCQGFNPIAALPDKNRVMAALAKLKWLVVMDPLATETSEFWQKVGPYNDVNSADNPDRSDSPAHHLFRRGRRLAGQQQSLVAMALEGGRRPWGGVYRHTHHERTVPAPASALSGRGRRLSRPAAQTVVAVQSPGRTVTGRTGQGGQRLRHHRLHRCHGGTRSRAMRNWPVSASSRTTAARRPGAGFSAAAGPKRATRWPGATTTTRMACTSTRVGHGPGRQTGGFSTTAPRPTRKASPGTRKNAWCGGTAKPGPAPMCRTTRLTWRRKRG